MNEAENWQIEDKDEGRVSWIVWNFVIVEDSIGIVLFQSQALLKPWFDFHIEFTSKVWM